MVPQPHHRARSQPRTVVSPGPEHPEDADRGTPENTRCLINAPSKGPAFSKRNTDRPLGLNPQKKAQHARDICAGSVAAWACAPREDCGQHQAQVTSFKSKPTHPCIPRTEPGRGGSWTQRGPVSAGTGCRLCGCEPEVYMRPNFGGTHSIAKSNDGSEQGVGMTRHRSIRDMEGRPLPVTAKHAAQLFRQCSAAPANAAQRCMRTGGSQQAVPPLCRCSARGWTQSRK